MKNMYKSLFKVLWNLVALERDNRPTCEVTSAHSPLMACSRAPGHRGMHIATSGPGGELEVYEIWGNTDSKDQNEKIALALELLARIIDDAGANPCDQRYESLGCTRAKGHKGIHVAIGTKVIAAWDSCVEGCVCEGEGDLNGDW